MYFVSYVPALLMLRIPGYENQNAKLMFFLVLVVQLSDVLQYVWGKVSLHTLKSFARVDAELVVLLCRRRFRR